jgi:hypothetical protein
MKEAGGNKEAPENSPMIDAEYTRLESSGAEVEEDDASTDNEDPPTE